MEKCACPTSISIYKVCKKEGRDTSNWILVLRNTALLSSVGPLPGQIAARSSPQSIFLQPEQHYISRQRVKLSCFITFQCSKGKLRGRYLTLNGSILGHRHCLGLQINFNNSRRYPKDLGSHSPRPRWKKRLFMPREGTEWGLPLSRLCTEKVKCSINGREDANCVHLHGWLKIHFLFPLGYFVVTKPNQTKAFEKGCYCINTRSTKSQRKVVSTRQSFKFRSCFSPLFCNLVDIHGFASETFQWFCMQSFEGVSVQFFLPTPQNSFSGSISFYAPLLTPISLQCFPVGSTDLWDKVWWGQFSMRGLDSKHTDCWWHGNYFRVK